MTGGEGEASGHVQRGLKRAYGTYFCELLLQHPDSDSDGRVLHPPRPQKTFLSPRHKIQSFSGFYCASDTKFPCNLRAMTTVSNGARPYSKVSTLGFYQGWPRPCELLTALWEM